MALAGCDADSVSPTGRALAPLSEKNGRHHRRQEYGQGIADPCPYLKKSRRWRSGRRTATGEFVLLKTYPICKWSGDLGPKKRQGDRQAPEGFYTIAPGQMNPKSNYYLAFNTGFPKRL